MSVSLKRYGITSRVLSIAIIPVLIVSLILAYYVTTTRINDVRISVAERGNILARNLAISSEFGLFSGNTSLLKSITDSLVTESDVEAVAIFDNENRAIVVSYHDDTEHSHDNTLSIFEQDHYMMFSAPVRLYEILSGDMEKEMLGGDLPRDMEKQEELGWVSVVFSMDSTKQIQYEILTNSLYITAAGLIISILLALRIGRSITQPVKKLSEMESRLREGKYDTHLQVSSGGELGRLEDGFNSLADVLSRTDAEQKRKISEATDKLQQTVQMLELRNTELDSARNQAQLADDAKSEFLARMSHEIRTPMNAVLGFSNLLKNTQLSNEQLEYSRTIHQAAIQLLAVIDDILDLSKLESGTIELEKTSFDVRGCLEDIVSMLGPSAHDKGLELVLLVDSDVPVNIIADSTRLSQVLTNLVNNAIKFTKEGGVTVQVSSEPRENNQVEIIVSVTDTGIGIPVEKQKDLFSAFTQADHTISRRFGGTGLGLAIAKKFIALMDGEIKVESEPGKGSKFWFSVETEVDQKTISSTLSDALTGTRVIVFDNNPFSRRSIRNNLLLRNMSVFVSKSMKLLLATLQDSFSVKGEMDLVILGLKPEEANNADVESYITTLRQVYTGPVLLLVSKEDYFLPANLSDNGKVLCDRKPVRRDSLYRSIDSLVNRQRYPNTITIATEANDGNAIGRYAGVKALVAEDNEFNRLLVCTMLRQAGMETVESRDGKQAVEKASEQQFDLILMDIHLPTLDGLSAAKLIRENKSF